MLLENKIAIFCGGAGHAGSAVAHVFVREGAEVFLSGRSPGALDEVARGIELSVQYSSESRQ